MIKSTEVSDLNHSATGAAKKKNENQANLWNIFKSLALSYPYNRILCWFGAFLMKNNQFRFFSGKIVTSLADIFTMEKAVFKTIF